MPNLALCTGSTADVTQGTYLASVGGTQYQVVDNLDGTYTVDWTVAGKDGHPSKGSYDFVVKAGR